MEEVAVVFCMCLLFLGGIVVGSLGAAPELSAKEIVSAANRCNANDGLKTLRISEVGNTVSCMNGARFEVPIDAR